MIERLVIVDGVRTPFCRAGTEFASLSADELGRVAVASLLARTDLDPHLVDEVIFGCVGQPAETSNIARVISLRAGIPERVPAVTVHRNCASGLEALTQAHQRICAGLGSVFIVGGVENMSRSPLHFSFRAAEKFQKLARAKTLFAKVRAWAQFRPSDFSPRSALQLALTDPVCGLNMGQTAELLVRDFNITRSEQDAFAMESHKRALAARQKLAEEICPVYVNGRAVIADNGPRTESELERISKLHPVFDRAHGTVTAGNSSQLTDGAVALLVMSESRAAKLGFKPMGILTGYAHAGCEPARMGLGPVYAIAQAETATGLALAQADLVEINEAFAAQVLAVVAAAQSPEFARKQLHRDTTVGGISLEKLNVNGGAIALGHPVGASGARLVLTSLLELRRRNGHRALVALCVGGGQGSAAWLERNK